MGLDTTHGCWNGSYNSFHHWKNKIAEVAGYKIIQDEKGFYNPDIDWEEISTNNSSGIWRQEPKDILMILIAHSDCDGMIDIKHQLSLAARLEELLPLLPDKDEKENTLYWKEKTQSFINGLRLANSQNEIIEFY